MRVPLSSARLFALAALPACVVLVLPGYAASQPAAESAERPLAEVVELEPGATCLETERLTQRIGRWRERDTVDARIRVKVRGDATTPNRVSFTVTKEGGESAERTLADAPTECDQLHSAVALAIGLSIDATLMGGARAEPPLPIPPPEPTPAQPKPAPSTLMPEREPPPSAASTPMRLELAVLAGPAVRIFQDTSLMFAPRLTFAPWPWLGFALVGMVTRAADQPVGDAKGHFDATVAVVGLDACFGGELDPSLSLYACGGPRLGGFFIDGGGFQKNFSHVDVWSALAGSAQVRAWLTDSIAVGAGLTFYSPLAKQVVRVAGTGSVEDQLVELPRLGIGVEVGPVFRFF